MSFGSRLKELRKEKHSSQKQVADTIGVSINTISQYESDLRFPSEEILINLCKYYGISSDYLLGLTNLKHAPIQKNELKDTLILPKQMMVIYDLIDMLRPLEEENEN